MPNQVYVTGNGGSVEDKGYDRANARIQLVDEPCNEEGQDVGYRAGNASEDQGILNRGYKQVIVKEQTNLVIHEDELRQGSHIK